ncbi:glycosyltransferase family 87 protein [Streptomyces sp. NPDC049687]|uniref:glycosyltransferase family 87 protein n=1 Tax=Streptomyces sp. NPDC049687 TaxID=3365596 RepID=UPI0037AC8D15
MERRRLLLALAAAWLATRALMLWLLAHDSLGILGGRVGREVWRLYHHWYGVLAHGAFPAHDTLWQYPPGAGVVLLSPGLLPWWTYFQAFVALTVLSDAVIAFALARAGTRPGRTLAGAAVWVGGLPLLVRVPFARYDVQVTALAVVSLLALSRSTRVCGAFAALGTLVKVWPALVLVGVQRGRDTRSVWASVALTGTSLLLLLVFVFRNPLAFLLQQGGRGVQIESLGGTLLSLATHAGWPGKVHYRYGAMEFTGPYVSTVAHTSLALTAVAFGLLLLWRIRARHWTEAVPYDAALSAVLLFTVTSRVISPQYMIWLVGLAAVCLTSRHTTQRPVATLILASTALSAVIFPVKYGEVIECSWTGTGLMVLRNGMLLLAAALSFARLWRTSTVRAPQDTGSYPQALRESRAPASL